MMARSLELASPLSSLGVAGLGGPPLLIIVGCWSLLATDGDW